MRWLGYVALFLLAPTSDVADNDPLAACIHAIEIGPQPWKGHGCLLERSANTGTSQEAIAYLEEKLTRSPDDHVARGTLARLYDRVSDDRARGAYQRAIRGLALSPDAGAEVSTRLSFGTYLSKHGDIAEAEAMFERALEVAGDLGDDDLLGEALIRQAAMWSMQSRQLGRAQQQLREVDATFGELLSPNVRLQLLAYLGAASFSTGRGEAAAAAYGRAAELAASLDDDYNRANALYNAAVARHETTVGTDRWQREPARTELREVLAVAERLGNKSLAARVRGLLAAYEDDDGAIALLEQCMHEDSGADPVGRMTCRRLLASRLGKSNELERALALYEENLQAARRYADPIELVFTLRYRVATLWSAQREVEAMRDAMAQIEAVEILRGAQDEALARAMVQANWGDSYTYVVDALLDRSEGPEIDLAFNVLERFRAQTLRDAMRRDASGTDVSAPRTIEGVLERLPVLEDASRQGLDRLVDRDHPVAADVQRRLGPREALVAFQIADTSSEDEPPSGAWAIVVTRASRRVVELPAAARIEAMIDALVGLYAAGHPTSEAVASVSDVLLADVLDSLDPSVDALVVVPDGSMHRLPLAALHDPRTGDPIVTRHRVSIVPSAAAWIGWRDVERPDRNEALVLADPVISDAARALRVTARPTYGGGRGATLQRLPYARIEARRVAEHLGDRVRVAIGDAASEAVLREFGEPSPALVHLASHALIDAEHPERGGIVLAPGDGDDGVLDASEVADLDLRGTTVVLAACSGADGLLLRGEGVMGFARALFEAGATTVVASLWPLSDADAADFFDELYEHLAEGATVAEAVARTQRSWIAAERNPATWAGVVVLGDGDVALFAPRRSRSAYLWWLGLGAAALVGSALLYRRNRRRG